MTTPATTDVWQHNKTLSKAMFHMQENDILTDVTFLVGETKSRVTAHRLVLVARSPVFYAMLEGALAEKGDIEVPDIDEETFKSMIRFAYKDSTDISDDTVDNIVYSAEKYDIIDLKMECERFLIQNTSPDNVFKNLKRAFDYSLDELKRKCGSVISLLLVSYTDEQLDEFGEFWSLSQEMIEPIFNSDDLSLPEIRIFRMAVKWGEADCRRRHVEVNELNIREALGPLLHCIRFPIMPLKIFCDRVSETNILNGEEKSQIFQSIVSPKEGKTTSFNGKSRNGYPRYQHETVKRKHHSYTGGTLHVSCKERKCNIEFQVDSSKLLTGLKINSAEKCEFLVNLFEEKRKINTACRETEKAESTEIYFAHDSEVMPNYNYRLELTARRFDQMSFPGFKPSENVFGGTTFTFAVDSPVDGLIFIKD